MEFLVVVFEGMSGIVYVIFLFVLLSYLGYRIENRKGERYSVRLQ